MKRYDLVYGVTGFGRTFIDAHDEDDARGMFSQGAWKPDPSEEISYDVEEITEVPVARPEADIPKVRHVLETPDSWLIFLAADLKQIPELQGRNSIHRRELIRTHSDEMTSWGPYEGPTPRAREGLDAVDFKIPPASSRPGP